MPPARNPRRRDLLLTACLLILSCIPAAAFTPCTLSTQDCPPCPAGGLALADTSVYNDTSFIATTEADYIRKGMGGSVLTCTYGRPAANDFAVMTITCYPDAATAGKWNQYHKKQIAMPFVDIYGQPQSGYYTSPRDSRLGCQAAIFSGGGKVDPACRTGRENEDFFTRGRFEAVISSGTESETRTADQATAFNRERIADYASCFAAFSPTGSAPAAGEARLHGTIIATRYPVGEALPLKHARVTLLEDGKKVLGTTTNAEGKYEFSWNFKKGSRYEIAAELTYATDKDYFTIFMKEPGDQNKVFFRKPFTYRSEADLLQDFNLDDRWKEKYGDSDNPFGIMYVHLAQALEFFKDDLHEDVHLNLPVQVVAFSDDPAIKKDRARYDFEPGSSTILFSPRASLPGSELRPYREYHEFSHYMVNNMYGSMPAPVTKSPVPSLNHGGFLNPDTTDSWDEGLATFLAALIAEKYDVTRTAGEIIITPCTGGYQYGDIETNWLPWNENGGAEELAVAGTLWDLFDSPARTQACDQKSLVVLRQMMNNPDVAPEIRQNIAAVIDTLDENGREYRYENDYNEAGEDKVSLTLGELWPVIRTYHPDLLSFHEKLVQTFPARKDTINEVFLMHGFWKETTPGNGTYDKEYPVDPYRDANGNGQYDPGEMYIDLTTDLRHNPGEVIGTAADASRPSRRTSVQFPGHVIRVNNNAPYYQYTVTFPGTTRRPYSVYAENQDGQVYVQVPPDPPSTITVKAVGVTTGNPLVFTSQQFRDAYAASVKQGYYVSHDFRLQGPVPPQPQVPSSGSSGFSGGLLQDLFRPEGPAARGMQQAAGGNMAGLVPVLLPVAAGILALAVLYRNRK
jgi:hypothetical protein